MNILVTGSAGFIGFHLVNSLIKTPNFNITGLDTINKFRADLKYLKLQKHGIPKNIKYNTTTQSQKYKNYKFIQLDLTDKENIQNVFNSGNFDIVINLAAQTGVRYSLENPEEFVKSNVLGFLNILESSKNCNIKHLIYASSSSVYGLNEKQPQSTKDCTSKPASIYAATKKSNELMAHTYSHLYGIQTTGLRFFTVYGPWGRPDMAPMLFTDAILNNKPIDVYNNGNMQRDFTYVGDVVQCIEKVINKKDLNKLNSNKYKIYNIGRNKPIKLLDFIEELENKLGKKAIKNMLPIQPGDVQKTEADVQDFITDFNYKPKTSLKDGISHFINWYKKENNGIRK